MSTRFYLMPMVLGGPGGTALVPKYESTMQVEGVGTAIVPYGIENVCLVAASGINEATHLLVAANSDVVTLPENIDQSIGAQLAVVQARLEALHIPADWVQSGFSYRSILRVVVLIFQLAQRYRGLGFGRLLEGKTLSTRWNQLSAGTKANLQQLASDLKFDTAGITNTSTIRQILKLLVDQWPRIVLRLQNTEL